jgi:pentatricopeptide repeat protein
METLAVERHLAAILAADVAGYSRLMAEDEEGTLHTLGAYRGTISNLIDEHIGRIFGAAGDSVIAEFASAVQAVRSAVAIQRALDRRNADLPQGRRMEFRIGINLGDVIAEGKDLLGDAVNVAARLQGVAQPNGICISGSVREQIVGKLDFPLAAFGERSLKNIPQPVQVYGVDWRLDDPAATGIFGGSLTLPDKPSIAVLPFANMSGDQEQEYFADGITEDIITALSHHRWFFVIARNSTFIYKGRAIDVKQVARELGVRYVLEGSVRKSGQRVRITGQLIEAATGNHLWAERFDRDMADVFGVQDEITQSVVGAIEPEMLLVEGRRASRKSPASLDAFDCSMRAMWHFHKFTPDDSQPAEAWLRRAIELDPHLAQAHMALARTLMSRIWRGWSRDIAHDLSEAHCAAERGVTLDDRDPYTHYALFLVKMLRRRHEQALAEAQRAIDLNPNFALGYYALGWIRIYIGHFAEALDPLLRSLRLNPNDPQAGPILGFVALAHYHQGKYEEAVQYAERGLRERNLIVLRTLLAGLGQLGRTDEARAVLAEMERIKPADAKRHWEITNPYADPAHRAHVVEGLGKAGFQV